MEIPFIAWHPIFKLPLPEGHRFPMEKYELIYEQLLHEGIVQSDDIFTPSIANKEELISVHDPTYINKLYNLELEKQEIRRIGLPLSEQLIERELRIAQGTIDASKAALKRGIGFNIAGGTHHAGHSWGEGFCLLNDQAVAANHLLQNELASKILILDLDVHQGNGTANIFQNHEKITTFSMHGQNNFPFKKEQSTIDIGLEDGINGEDYLEILSKELKKLTSHSFDFLFYQAGVDVLESDKLGKLKLTKEECKQRDQLVFQFAKNNQLPIQISMGGGYSPQIKDIVDAHINTYKVGIAEMLK